MTDLTPNRPEVVAEVRALFERYEQALIDKTVEVLDADLLGQPAHDPLRAPRERLRLRRHPRPSGGPPAGARASRSSACASRSSRSGAISAAVNLEFKVRGRDLIGRQSQTWVRFPDLGWKVIAAHVSTMNAAPIW